MSVRAARSQPKAAARGQVKAQERKLAATRFFWLDLNARLEQARKHGITLEEATRRLEAREAAERNLRRRARKPSARGAR